MTEYYKSFGVPLDATEEVVQMAERLALIAGQREHPDALVETYAIADHNGRVIKVAYVARER